MSKLTPSTPNPEFLRRAIALAIQNVDTGAGGPFAAVIVRDGKIVGEGVNTVTATLDPTAHGEVNAIRAACTALGAFTLDGCELYTSCEPCPMCLAAIYWSRLDRSYYAATCEDAAAAGFDDRALYRELTLPVAKRWIPMVQSLREEACLAFQAWLEKEDRLRY